MIAENIKKQIGGALEKLGIAQGDFVVDATKDFKNGDYASNIALVLGKKTGVNPLELAKQIQEALPPDRDGYIDKVEVAGPGFLNFFVSDTYLLEVQKEILDEKIKFGWANPTSLTGKNELHGARVMVEYTDPNI